MPSNSIKNKVIDKETVSYSDNWIYILLLTTLIILTESIKNYTFDVSYVKLSYSLLLLPFSYFLINIITKKYGYLEAIRALAISAVALIIFVVSIDYIVGNGITLNNVYADFCGYAASGLINITIYYFLITNTTSPSLLIFLTYIFSLVVNYFIFMLMKFNSLSLEYFWISYFCTIIIQAIICGVLTFIDKYIKRGI